MRAEEIGSQEAKLIFTRDEVAQLAAMAIKHSDNEELRDKLEATYAVMGVVHGDEPALPIETIAPNQVGGSRADEILDEESLERVYASRPNPGGRRPRRRISMRLADVMLPDEIKRRDADTDARRTETRTRLQGRTDRPRMK